MIATKTYVKDVYDDLVLLAKLGVNAITMGEESMYSWNSSPEETKKLDEIFKANNCTFSGTGFADVYRGYLPTVLAGSAHKVNKIIGKT